MEEILDAIRRIIRNWTITTVRLTESAVSGDNIVTVTSTRRFRKGDEILIRNGAEKVEMPHYVADIVDDYNLELVDPIRFDWLVADDAAVVKTVHQQYVKAVFIGEPDIIPQFPAITVNGTARDSDWYTVRATKEKFNIEIGVFVQDATHEDGYRFLLKMADLIQLGLKKNIYPMPNNYDSTSLIQNIAENDTVIKIADTSFLECGSFILVEDSVLAEPNVVKRIIDSQTIEVTTTFANSFDMANTLVIRPRRYIYNSWPATIQYGKIHKGTLLKAAVINYFVEETEIQGEGGFQDPQLS